jgi:glycosyltransferase involved in cell wall biosynthesis
MKISIITAVFNGSETIADAINSLNSQSYKDIEHIVIDGISTDSTLKIVRALAKDATLISERDNGIYDALNKGIKLSTGEIVGFLHADDFFANDNVLADIALAFEDSEVDAVYGDLLYVGKKNEEKIIRRWKSSDFDKDLLLAGWMPPHPTLFVRRKWYERISFFDDSYRISADYASVLKLFSVPNFNAIYLNKILVKMRVGGVSNRSLFGILKKMNEDWIALRSVGYSIGTSLKALLLKNCSKIIQFL